VTTLFCRDWTRKIVFQTAPKGVVGRVVAKACREPSRLAYGVVGRLSSASSNAANDGLREAWSDGEKTSRRFVLQEIVGGLDLLP